MAKQNLTESEQMRQALNVVAGKKVIKESVGVQYRPGGSIKASNLRAGNCYFIKDRDSGEMDLIKFLGFNDPSVPFGKSGPVFDTLKELARKYNAKSLQDLESIGDKVDTSNRPTGNFVYAVVDLLAKDASDGVSVDINNPIDQFGITLQGGRWHAGSPSRISFLDAVESSEGQVNEAEPAMDDDQVIADALELLSNAYTMIWDIDSRLAHPIMIAIDAIEAHVNDKEEGASDGYY